jgi:secreted PhoX family phosphatase
VHDLPWLGEFSHENTIIVPYFYETTGKIVLLSSEDGDATESEMYMYVADSAEDVLTDNGQLFVFGADDASMFENHDDIYHAMGAVDGHWIPLVWDWATQDEFALHDEAVAKGAFEFIRAEDLAMDKRAGFENILYLADTGNDRDEFGALIPAGTNGQTFTHGRIFEFAFTDPQDPTQSTFEVMIDGDDPLAPGYNLMINPDNIDTSAGSLMIQEDRIGVNRFAVGTALYDVTKNAKILQYDLAQGKLVPVAYVDQSVKAPMAKYGDWESSGIVDASSVFGEGAWLVDVQAHSLETSGPAGQLLLLRIEGS